MNIPILMIIGISSSIYLLVIVTAFGLNISNLVFPVIYASTYDADDITTAIMINEACQYYKDTGVIDNNMDCGNWINSIEGKMQFKDYVYMKAGEIMKDFKGNIENSFPGLRP